MQNLDAFFKYVRQHVTGVPEPILAQAVLDSCIQFAEESNILAYTLGPVNTTAGGATYSIPLPPQTQLVMIDKAWIGTRRLTLTPPMGMEDPTAVFGTVGTQTRPVGYTTNLYEIGSDSFGLYPAPDAANAKPVTLSLSVRPLNTATQVDDILLEDWPETIAAGAIYRIASTPGQLYTNPGKASEALMMFVRGLNRARNRSYKGRVISNATIAMRPLA